MTDPPSERRVRRVAPASAGRIGPERRTARRAARRRQTMKRFVLLISGLVIVAAVVSLLLVFVGAPGGKSGAATTQTTHTTRTTQAAGQGSEATAAPQTTLLAVQQGGKTPVFVLLHPLLTGGVVMGMPGPTLVKTSEGFKTLADLEAGGQGGTLASSLTDMLGAKVSGVAVVEWTELLRVLSQAGVGGPRPGTLGSDSTAASQVVDAVGAVANSTGTDAGRSAVKGMVLKGDTAALDVTLKALGSGGWSQVTLPGKAVEGLNFAYFEPDVAVAKTLLEGKSSGAAISLEVQNGSGLVAGAEKAAEVLKPLGYTLLPVKNADGFPDVQTTRIIASPDTAVEAARVRTLLGVGTVEQDADQPVGHVVVIVGKDFVPPAA